MSGKDFRDKPVLAAVKPFTTADSLVESRKAIGSGATPGEAGGTSLVEGSTDLETLFEQHHDRIFRTAYRITGSAADAEDVLQTVFLRVARSQESLATENPGSYFARAAINASLDLLRGRKRSRAIALEDAEDAASVTTHVSRQNPETHQEDRELRELIREAVSKLGPTAAQMFALRYFEGYDNGEIGQAMGTSAIVVGVTLHRARARLRKEIGSYLQRHSSA